MVIGITAVLEGLQDGITDAGTLTPLAKADIGVAEQVNEHATIVDQGFTALALLDGRADLALQQMSELLSVPEAKIAGPLPPDVQHYTAFSAGSLSRQRTVPTADHCSRS